nr:tetratricopeptide repeat protein [Micromonospora sp. DSM 115978]
MSDLAALLRTLRRRHARQNRDRELTYRELANRTGWSVAAVAEYLTGKTLPPTDRFDTLIRLLGASPAEQGALATARDRVAEQHRRAPRRPRRPAGGPVPRQIPADVFAFTGRDEELNRLDALLADAPTAVVISAVSGTAGVGKTALAVHWAHRVADRFPDGHLHLNLRGHDPDRPMPAGDALARLLAGIGVPDQDIPIELEERSALWRTRLAGRRMLILLDNAGTVEQVRPLLPGTPGCAVVVTSRDRLAGLVARDGARRLDLDLLPMPDAVALLTGLIGPRIAAEPEAVRTLATQCARLPLALRVAAELAAARPETPLAELTRELAERQRRLELLDADGDRGTAVAAVFSWSVQHLSPSAARTFRLLGLHPGPDLEAYAVAALAGTDHTAARDDLDDLARAHLVHPTSAGRFGMHDLLRAYAGRLASASDPAADRHAAQQRLFDGYLATARAATELLDLAAGHRRPADAAGTPIRHLADAPVARTWLATELPNLAAVAAYTAGHGWPGHTVALAIALHRYLDGGHYADSMAIHAHALGAAERGGDRSGQAYALIGLGVANLHLCRYEAAVGYLGRAQSLAELAGDRPGQARALSVLGNLERTRGRHGPAAEHLRQALDLARRAGDAGQEALALTNLGTVEAQQGRYLDAIAHLERSVPLFQRAGDRLGEAIALTNLGLAERRLERHDRAVDHLGQALSAFRQLGHRQGEANTLDNLGSVHLALGLPRRALEYFNEALAICREIDDREVQAWVLNGLGEAAHAVGQADAALAHHTEALGLASDIGAREPQARAHAGLGHVHRAKGDLVNARHHFERAVTGYTALRSTEADAVRALLAAIPA